MFLYQVKKNFVLNHLPQFQITSKSRFNKTKIIILCFIRGKLLRCFIGPIVSLVPYLPYIFFVLTITLVKFKFVAVDCMLCYFVLSPYL